MFGLVLMPTDVSFETIEQRNFYENVNGDKLFSKSCFVKFSSDLLQECKKKEILILFELPLIM